MLLAYCDTNELGPQLPDRPALEIAPSPAGFSVDKTLVSRLSVAIFAVTIPPTTHVEITRMGIAKQCLLKVKLNFDTSIFSKNRLVRLHVLKQVI
jgi:hypothetical protein